MGILDDIFGGMFGGSEHPGDDANKFLDQIPEAMRPYFQKYIDRGDTAGNALQGQYKDLLGDPGSILSNIGKGYKQSPGFEFNKTQGENSINNAAASGGMLGTNQHQQQAGDLATSLASKDYGDYMKNAIGLYGQGLEGTEKQNDQGFDASTGMGKLLASILGTKGGNAFEEGAAKNKGWSDMLADLIAGGGKFAEHKGWI